MYDFIKTVATNNQTTFTEEYKNYLEQTLITHEQVLNKILTELCQKDVFIGKHFFGENYQSKKTSQNEKFYEDNETSIKIPVLTIYPPDFVLENGVPIDIQISEDIVKAISSVLGHVLKLDWIRFVNKENHPEIKI